MAVALAERAVDGELWACACGKSFPIAIGLCPWCSRPGPNFTPADLPPHRPRRVRGVRLAFGVVLLNVLFQIITVVMVVSGRMDGDEAINLSLWSGLVFYVLVGVVIASPLESLRPRWLRGNRQTAAVLGIEVGLASAAGLILLFWIGSGGPMLDPSVEAIVSEGTIARTLLAFLLIAVAAPLIEELLFRGVVAESLARNGAAVAVGVSSVMFALAHLRSLPYYTGCGVVLGLLYWKRGLWASIAAHATFNGCLVMLAVVVAFGPARLLSSSGVTVEAPASWQLAPEEAAVAAGASFALDGPGDSSFLVRREQIPGGARIPLDELASAYNDGTAPLPPESRLTGSAEVTSLPAGRALELEVNIAGHDGVILLLPKRGTVWMIEVAISGSQRAEREYPEILESLTLPAEVG
jgi:membrane protease YdiL (CAAX protease family)